MKNFYTQNSDSSIRYYSNSAALLALQDPDMEQLATEKNIVYGYDGKLYFEGAEPQKSLADVQSAALEKLRQRKWQAKEAGITVNGIKIDTDSTGQETISGAVLNCLINPDFTAKWKTAAVNPDGTAVWLEIGKAEIMALAAALTAHTEACFVVEESKQTEIAALKSADAVEAWLKSNLDAGWPGDE